MELPVDLWSIILQKTKITKQCKKLYLALPKNIKKELEEIYEEHKVKISINILCGIKNNMTLFQNGDLHTVFYQDHDFDNDIKFVRYVKNWYIINKEGDKLDCYISVSQNDRVLIFLSLIFYQMVTSILCF